MIQPQAEEAGLKFEIQAGQAEHLWFCGDMLRISQILINLLGNAVKFTPEGGSVTLRVEEIAPVQMQVQEPHVRYRFTVTDTGVGMTESFRRQLFEPFTRDQNVERVEGSGLGLSIAKGLVDLMGGTITVESRLLKGSSFCIELEFRESLRRDVPETPGKGKAAEGMPSLAGRYFLAAEDNPVNAEILCELLRMCGARTDLRTDGQQTVQAYLNAPAGTYDAVLMDIRMPKMDGCEASRAIRSSGRADAETIPIIAMTANAFAEDVQTSLQAGMNAHIAKPLDLKVLWKTLEELLP